jgi:hypothetical protein
MPEEVEPVVIEPLEIFAGDSIHFVKTLADFPASMWTLAYRMLSQQGAVAITLTATADNEDYDVTVARSTTASWTPGEYWMIGYVYSATERVQVYAERIAVKPDPATVTNFDGRTYPERMLALIEKVIEEGVIRETISYSYGGVSVQVQSMQDAFTIRAWLIAEVKWEKQGKPAQVLTRFF